MDTTGITNLATTLSQASVQDSAELMVLRKASNLQSASALQLIASIQPMVVPSEALPPHLGQNVNTVV